MDAKQEGCHQPLRILLVNVHSYWNAGDNALTQEALRQLVAQFPQASFILAMNDPASHEGRGRAVGSFTSWVKPIVDRNSSGWRWRAFPGLILHSLLALVGYRLRGRPCFVLTPPEQRGLLEAYFEADMVVSTAGNFLYTSGWLGLPFLLALYSIFYGWLARKPLYTLPQTLGPISRKRELFLTRYVLSKVRIVLVRDPISAEVWQQWGVQGPQWELNPDLAFAFAESEGQVEAGELLSQFGVQGAPHEICLGVTLINWGAQDQTFSLQSVYEEAIETAIRDFLQSHGSRVVLFAQVHGPTAAQDDLIPARRVLARLVDLGNKVVLMDRWAPPPVLKAAYGHMDFFLGTRLHSNIFALTEGVPVVAIGYQYKTRGIMRMLDLEPWVLDIQEVKRETLVRLLRRAWEERDNTRAHIREMIPQVSKQAARAGTLIASDFRASKRNTEEDD
jgi:colanic acid/amylovoran biosynthesis protein